MQHDPPPDFISFRLLVTESYSRGFNVFLQWQSKERPLKRIPVDIKVPFCWNKQPQDNKHQLLQLIKIFITLPAWRIPFFVLKTDTRCIQEPLGIHCFSSRILIDL